MPVPFAKPLELTADQSERLRILARAGSTPQALAFRLRVVLRAAQGDGAPNEHIAAELRCSRHTVAKWRERFREHGLAGLQDAPRSGRPPSFSPRGTAHRLYARDPVAH